MTEKKFVEDTFRQTAEDAYDWVTKDYESKDIEIDPLSDPLRDTCRGPILQEWRYFYYYMQRLNVFKATMHAPPVGVEVCIDMTLDGTIVPAQACYAKVDRFHRKHGSLVAQPAEELACFVEIRERHAAFIRVGWRLMPEAPEHVRVKGDAEIVISSVRDYEEERR